MPHAQTNLQLYRQAIEASWDEASLSLLRRSYDFSLLLFADAYRTSRRPFTAHLVGTASMLIAWGERPALAAAGLLHSAYMLGHFGDGGKNVTPSRRAALTAAVGPEVESLVHDYTLTKNEDQLAQWCQASQLSETERDLAALQVANLYDDLCDGEPRFAPAKARTLGLPWDKTARESVIRLAERVIGSVAASALNQQFQEIDRFQLPDCLRIENKQPRRVIAGLAEVQPPVIRRFLCRVFPFLKNKRAA